jgi:hypothetical protein
VVPLALHPGSTMENLKLNFISLFNPTFFHKDQDDETHQKDHILLFVATSSVSWSSENILRNIGLAQGILDFSR